MKKQTLKFQSGISPKSSMSYQKYLEQALSILNSNFNLKVYKRADTEKFTSFIKGTDLRVQIRWKEQVLDEFFVEKMFFEKGNSNKEDRLYMRSMAEVHLIPCKNALDNGTRKATINGG